MTEVRQTHGTGTGSVNDWSLTDRQLARPIGRICLDFISHRSTPSSRSPHNLRLRGWSGTYYTVSKRFTVLSVFCNSMGHKSVKFSGKVNKQPTGCDAQLAFRGIARG